MGRRLIQGRVVGAVIENQDVASLCFHGAHAQSKQQRVANPRNDAQVGNLLGSGSHGVAVIGRHVVDGEDGELVAFANGLELGEQPFTVFGRDIDIALEVGIPAAE